MSAFQTNPTSVSGTSISLTPETYMALQAAVAKVVGNDNAETFLKSLNPTQLQSLVNEYGKYNVLYDSANVQLPAVVSAPGGAVPPTPPTPPSDNPTSSNPVDYKSLFSNLKNGYLFKGKGIDFDINSLLGKAKDFRNSKIFEEGNTTVGGAANTLSGIYQLGAGIKNGTDAINAGNSESDAIRQVNSEAFANPMAYDYLSGDEAKTLRQVQRGNYQKANLGDAGAGIIKGLPKTALATLLGGLSGGIGGAAINGIGSLVNSGIQGYTNAAQDSESKLSGLYSSLRNANQQYKDERNRRSQQRYFANNF